MAYSSSSADFIGRLLVDGAVVRRGALPGNPSVSLAEIARTIAPTSKTRGDFAPGLSAEGWFFTDHMVHPYGIHVAVVRVVAQPGTFRSNAIWCRMM
jgi:carbon-monoxide dehydrogenase large subunit/6-hydroxypseudooxynicotine dehydrogenase subunit gamma